MNRVATKIILDLDNNPLRTYIGQRNDHFKMGKDRVSYFYHPTTVRWMESRIIEWFLLYYTATTNAAL